jgi:hypothetical protein
MKISTLKSLTIEYDDGIELIVERNGSRISLSQKMPVLGVDGTEEDEEWEAGGGELITLE